MADLENFFRPKPQRDNKYANGKQLRVTDETHDMLVELAGAYERPMSHVIEALVKKAHAEELE